MYSFAPFEMVKMKELQEENNQRRLATADFKDWHPEIKWERELNITASSYTPPRLFEVRPLQGGPYPNKAEPDQYVRSPSSMWQYQLNELSAGDCLNTWCGSRVGTVMFDGPVVTPAIYRRTYGDLEERFDNRPWMSLTPAELLSLRVGTRKARGHVVIAGLGMGHQLIQVCNRKNVRRVTLVELDQEIVDWILPVIRRRFPKGKLVDVIVGDAYKVLPKLKADIALVDIFHSYGNNYMDMWKMPPLPNIKKVWLWGAAST